VRRAGLYWFGNDLRLADQPGLLRAAAEVEELICLYVVDPRWFRASRYSHTKPIGPHRERFLLASLRGLSAALEELGQHLHVVWAKPLDVIPTLITRYGVSHLYRGVHPGYDEQRAWRWLWDHYPQLLFVETENQTLLSRRDLPFELSNLPPTFSAFRRKVETLELEPAAPFPDRLPVSPVQSSPLPPLPEPTGAPFEGGERAARRHRVSYFSSDRPGRYKEDRNALDGWALSTKLSPWLALGCQSPKQVMGDLHAYEARYGANESSEWIHFELLWREYFHWSALAQGADLFRFGGKRRRSPNTSFYPERFRKWCDGNTPYPLVNACMRQLNQTGYLSNRGRQIAASCLVNELSLDWRYGAAYFQEQLVDYDVGSNWGNWQYIAGVGADPRGGRHFNLDKQAREFDPNGDYVRRWGGGESTQPLDSVDAADWPVDGRSA